MALGERSWVEHNCDFRSREQYGLIQRANYLYGMLRAADVANYFGYRRATVIEFGVADGNGLRSMIALADLIKRETQVELDIVGFDTGTGLPAINGYKDHPEIWNIGDFTNVDRDSLMRDIEGRARIVWGDIADTIGDFVNATRADSPIGFVSVDVDIYSATIAALKCLEGPTQYYLPAVSMYFDDVGFFFANQWAGELLAINEFNQQNSMRKIDRDRSLPGLRPVRSEGWYSQMFVCHILDHTARQTPQERESLSIAQHFLFMKEQNII